jgi:hypothetical protein
MEVGQGSNWGCSAKGKKNAIKVDETERRVARLRNTRNAYRTLIGKLNRRNYSGNKA